jgi:hyaluronoglucosaminidase
VRGIIEGFYGPPWSWADRRRVSVALADVGMDTYVYAPKDDPLHREQWREPDDDAFLDELSALGAPGGLRIGFAVSPGLSIDPDGAEDRDALLAKITRVTARGVTLVGLCLDDLPPAPGLGRRHGELTAWLADALGDDVDLFLVPTHYTGTVRTPYLDELDRCVPPDVPIGWTGRLVVNDEITAAAAEAWSTAMGGRRPLLWDNTPVNDALMAARLRAGPLRGRAPDLVPRLGGYLANPMVQAAASLPALLSAAAWLRGDDPTATWVDALGDQRVLAEGCDTDVPLLLGRRFLDGEPGAGAELRAWLEAAVSCEAGPWGEEVAPWADQLRREARVCLAVLDALSGDGVERARRATVAFVLWSQARSLTVEVLGGRGGITAGLGQDADGGWVADRSTLVAPASLTDLLIADLAARL